MLFEEHTLQKIMLSVFIPQGDGQAVVAGAKAVAAGFGKGEKGKESVVGIGANRPEERSVRLSQAVATVLCLKSKSEFIYKFLGDSETKSEERKKKEKNSRQRYNNSFAGPLQKTNKDKAITSARPDH